MGSGHDLEARPVLEARPFEPLPVLLQRAVVRVPRVLLPAQHHRRRVRRTGTGRPRARACRRRRSPCPARSRSTRRGTRGRRASSSSRVMPGIADLDLAVEQALLGGDQRAPPVDVDRAPLEDDLAFRCRRPGAGAVPAPWRPARRPASSFSSSGYFAQALNRKPTTATSRAGRSRRTKIGPKSRVQPRSVGNRKNSTRGRVDADAGQDAAAPSPRGAADSTRMRTVSPAAILRTISP